MTRAQIIEIENAGNKLACVPVNPQYNGEWAEKQPNFVDFISFAGDYIDNTYAVLEIPESMTKEEFHTAISRECESLILSSKEIKSW